MSEYHDPPELCQVHGCRATTHYDICENHAELATSAADAIRNKARRECRDAGVTWLHPYLSSDLKWLIREDCLDHLRVHGSLDGFRPRPFRRARNDNPGTLSAERWTKWVRECEAAGLFEWEVHEDADARSVLEFESSAPVKTQLDRIERMLITIMENRTT